METILTWNEYKYWVGETVKLKYGYYCRGQSNPDWKLQTTFHREIKESSVSDYTLQEYLDKILPEVQYHFSAAQNKFIDITQPSEFASFLAFIQHHGFPTPLLDWTLSPYIAVYFAFREVIDQHPTSDYVKIFLFDANAWVTTFNQPLDLRSPYDFISIIRPYAINIPRILPQMGVFTASNVDDMEEYIETKEKETQKRFLYTSKISVKEKPQVMRELNLMGINEMSLFPGMDGICRTLKTLIFSPDTIGLTLSEIFESFKTAKDKENDLFEKPKPDAT